MKKKVKLKIPSRYHIDVMDIQKMHIGKVGGGGIGIGINMNCYVSLEFVEENEDIIICKKKKLVKYYLDLMRSVLHINQHFKITEDMDERYESHNGMGSNVMIQNSIVYGINYLYGCPLSKLELISLLRAHYIEEEYGHIMDKVYCSGVGNNTIMFGGLCFIDENGELIFNKIIPESFKVITMKASFNDIFENENIDKDEVVVNLRKRNDINKFFYKKNKIIRNKIIPDLLENKYDSLIEEMKNFAMLDDSFVLSQKCRINDITYNELYNTIMDIPNTIMRVASNSPNVCLITDRVKEVKNICNKNNIGIRIYDINNTGIEIIEKEEHNEKR